MNKTFAEQMKDVLIGLGVSDIDKLNVTEIKELYFDMVYKSDEEGFMNPGEIEKELFSPENSLMQGAIDDKQYKKIKELESPLYKLSKIKGYKFDWLPEAQEYNSYNKGTDIGVMSDEVELMYPELVQTRESGYKAVDYEKLTAVLIAAVNDLTSKLIEKGVLDEELQSSKSCCKANSRKNRR